MSKLGSKNHKKLKKPKNRKKLKINFFILALNFDIYIFLGVILCADFKNVTLDSRGPSVRKLFKKWTKTTKINE